MYNEEGMFQGYNHSESPAYPLETKVGSTAGVKFYVIVS